MTNNSSFICYRSYYISSPGKKKKKQLFRPCLLHFLHCFLFLTNKRPFNTDVVVLLSSLFSAHKFIARARLIASETERAPFTHREDAPWATQASSPYPTNVLQTRPKRSERQAWGDGPSAISIASLIRFLKLPKH